MNGRHAICIVIDGLRASALGCYGNTIGRTPNFDDFASRSAVIEWFWADSPLAENFYRATWHGTHAMRSEEFYGKAPSLCDLLHDHATPMRLITDEPAIGEQFSSDELVVIDSPTGNEAEDILETGFAQFCGQAIEQLEHWHDDGAGSVTWIHSRGLLAAWDAPCELRTELLDEDDPDALDIAEPPKVTMAVDDPDQLLLYRTAYAAQVAVIDSCFGALWRSIEGVMSDREALMILTGSSGFPLGEHGQIGSDDCRLHSERIHLPWLLHVCDDHEPRPRLSGLAQPADIHATLLDWLGIESPPVSDGQSVLPGLENEANATKELAVAIGNNDERALITPAWMLRQAEPDTAELFAKPDDRWEHNDVAVRCPDEVERLNGVFEGFQVTAKSGQPLPTTIEDADLVTPAR